MHILDKFFPLSVNRRKECLFNMSSLQSYSFFYGSHRPQSHTFLYLLCTFGLQELARAQGDEEMEDDAAPEGLSMHDVRANAARKEQQFEAIGPAVTGPAAGPPEKGTAL